MSERAKREAAAVRTLLVAVWGFPPRADVGGLRASKFCKYLPRHGWHPVVLTVDPRYYGTKRVGTVPRELAGMEIRRIPWVPLPGARLLGKLLFPLLVGIYAALRRRRFDAFYIDGGPFHPFVVVPFVALALRLPCIVDFRDSWSTSEHIEARTFGPTRGLYRRLRRGIEWLGIRFAARVLYATGALKREYDAAWPRFRARFRTVWNGFDPEDYEGLSALPARSSRRIALAGKLLFYMPLAVTGLFDALRRYPDVEFLYVGQEAAGVRALADRAGVGARVRTLPFLARRDLIPLLADSDFGLMTNSLANGLGTKIFDYLALRKPTLCLVPAGSVVSEVFGDCPSVLVREAPHTPASLAEAFDALLSARGFDDGGRLGTFDRRHAAEALAGILDEIVSRGGNRPGAPA